MEKRRRGTVRDGWKRGSGPREREAARVMMNTDLPACGGREERKQGGRKCGGRKENSQGDMGGGAKECVLGGIIL